MTDLVEFREGTRADRDAILELRKVVFPDDADKQHCPFWEWQFAHGYAGEGRVFVAESDDRIVAHFAFVPQRYAKQAVAIRGALAVDVMTHPHARRKKVFSRLAAFAASHLERDFQVVLAFQIREPVRAGMEAGGWRAAAEIPILVKPLSFRGIAHDLGLPLQPRAARRLPERGTSIRILDDTHFEKVDALLESSHPRQPRTAEFLGWRYRRNPSWKYELLGFFRGDHLKAFLIHRDVVLRGMRCTAIADGGYAPPDTDALKLLIRYVCHSGKARGMSLASALLSPDHPGYALLEGSGFLRGPHRFRLLLQVFDTNLHWAYDTPWSLSWGDTDHL